MAGSSTRSSDQNHLTELVGSPADLPLSDLPTRRNILQKMLLERLQDPRDTRNIPNMEIAGKVARAAMAAWRRINARMAIVKEKEVVRKVCTLWERLEGVTYEGRKKKKGKKKKYGQAAKEKEKFLEDLDRLFDICVCHCPILTCIEYSCQNDCQAKVHIDCSCTLDAKIPHMELEFMHDQRTKVGVKGRMMIGVIDAVETSRQEKALQREIMEKKKREEKEEREAAKEEELFAKHRRWEQKEEALMQEWEAGPEPTLTADDDGSIAAGKVYGQQNREHFPRTVMAAMRGGVSTRTLANILSSYSVDIGLATKEDPSLLVDHSKVCREQERQMARVTANAEEWMRTSGIDGIQFDGKDEKAKAWVTLGCGTKVLRHIKEDHITLTDCSAGFTPGLEIRDENDCSSLNMFAT